MILHRHTGNSQFLLPQREFTTSEWLRAGCFVFSAPYLKKWRLFWLEGRNSQLLQQLLQREEEQSTYLEQSCTFMRGYSPRLRHTLGQPAGSCLCRWDGTAPYNSEKRGRSESLGRQSGRTSGPKYRACLPFETSQTHWKSDILIGCGRFHSFGSWSSLWIWVFLVHGLSWVWCFPLERIPWLLPVPPLYLPLLIMLTNLNQWKL